MHLLTPLVAKHLRRSVWKQGNYHKIHWFIIIFSVKITNMTILEVSIIVRHTHTIILICSVKITILGYPHTHTCIVQASGKLFFSTSRRSTQWMALACLTFLASDNQIPVEVKGEGRKKGVLPHIWYYVYIYIYVYIYNCVFVYINIYIHLNIYI